MALAMDDVKPSRREKSAATRLKILRAAEHEFTEKGYHGATMASIAARAGVANPTVYFVFHTKSALISELLDHLVMGEEEPMIPQDSPWWAEMLAAPGAQAGLRLFILGAGELFRRASGISEILRAAALTDDEVRATHLQHERLREEGFREALEALAVKSPFRAGLDLNQATAVLLTILSDSTYVLFTTERGWSHEQTISWLGGTLPGLVFEE